MRRLRRDVSQDQGISLAELLVGMMIFGLLMAMVTAVMIALTNMSKDSLARTRAISEARIGVAQIDRQVRSGNVILDPANEGILTSGVPAYFSMRIYTQEDGPGKCAQWRVIDHDDDGYGDLEFRTWNPAYPSIIEVTTWSPVAHNLVTMDVAPDDATDIDPDDESTWPPFWVDEQSSGGTDAQFVKVTLRLKDPSEDGTTKATAISTTVTGRNTVFNYPTSYCAIAPAP